MLYLNQEQYLKVLAMNYINITNANYLPITERKVLRLPTTGVLLLLALVLARVTLLPPTLQEDRVAVAVVPHEATLGQAGIETP